MKLAAIEKRREITTSTMKTQQNSMIQVHRLRLQLALILEHLTEFSVSFINFISKKRNVKHKQYLLSAEPIF
jgi:hypothetical protein